MPLSSRTSRTTWARLPRTSWQRDTLTAMPLSGSPSSRQARACAVAVRSTQLPIVIISPASSASGNELRRRHPTELGRFPAQQRLRGEDPALGPFDLGLVVELDLPVGQGLREQAGDGAAALGDPLGRLPVEAHATAALHRLADGQLGLVEDGLGGEPVRGSEGHPRARGEDDLLVAREVPAGHAVHEQLDGGLQLLPARKAGEHGREDPAADPGRHRHRRAHRGAQHFLRAEADAQPLGDLLEHGVRARAPEPVVDEHEVLDVEEGERDLAALGWRPRARSPAPSRGARRSAGR